MNYNKGTRLLIYGQKRSNVCINPAFLAAEHQTSGRTHGLCGTNQSKEGFLKRDDQFLDVWLCKMLCYFPLLFLTSVSDWAESKGLQEEMQTDQTVRFDRGMWSVDMLQITFLFLFSLLSVCPLQVNASLWGQASSCSTDGKVWTSSDFFLLLIHMVFYLSWPKSWGEWRDVGQGRVGEVWHLISVYRNKRSFVCVCVWGSS